MAHYHRAREHPARWVVFVPRQPAVWTRYPHFLMGKSGNQNMHMYASFRYRQSPVLEFFIRGLSSTYQPFYAHVAHCACCALHIAHLLFSAEPHQDDLAMCPEGHSYSVDVIGASTAGNTAAMRAERVEDGRGRISARRKPARLSTRELSSRG
jgi:hypothetical protein